MFKLQDPDLLRRLMRRTGTGGAVSVRVLATDTGVPRSTINALLTGKQQAVPVDKAHAISTRIGVDVLVLFAPVGRAVQLTPTERQAPIATADEAVPA